MRRLCRIILVCLVACFIGSFSAKAESVSGLDSNGESSSESWVCFNCGQKNTTNFCEECGAKKPSWVCVCGKINHKKFCGDCGRSYEEIMELSATQDLNDNPSSEPTMIQIQEPTPAPTEIIPDSATMLAFQSLRGEKISIYYGFITAYSEKLSGEVVKKVAIGSPAKEAGLQVSDVVVEADGIGIDSEYSLAYAFSKKKIGETISLLIKRAGNDLAIDYKLSEKPIVTPTIVPTPESTPNTIQYPLPDGANRSIEIEAENIEISVGERMELMAHVIKLREDAPEKSSLLWESSNNKVATVSQEGIVMGVFPGEVEIVCCIKDTEIKTGILIRVEQLVESVKLSESEITLLGGDSKKITASVYPENASNRELSWSSSSRYVADVVDGVITANTGGNCEIICETKDGSNKIAKIKVHVPTISVEKTEYTITDKKGIVIPIKGYGGSEYIDAKVSSGCFTYDWDKNTDLVISPVKAGSGTIKLISHGYTSDDVITIKITVAASAVYSTDEFPKIDYKYAYRYPDANKNKKVSFSGTVQQVIDQTAFRISSRGKYDDIVYVTIAADDLVIPLIEKDNVTVYGRLVGNYTYVSVWGNSVTIPKVVAEKIDLK